MDPVISILWCIMGLLVGIQYAPMCAGLSWQKKLLCSIIFLIGGPFFIVTNILEAILDVILPEGWDDENKPGSYS